MNQYRTSYEAHASRLARKSAMLKTAGLPIAWGLVVIGVPFMMTGWACGKALDLLQSVARYTAHPLLRSAREARAEAVGLVSGYDASADGDEWTDADGYADYEEPVAPQLGANLMGADWDEQYQDGLVAHRR